MPGIINLHGHIGNTVDLARKDPKFYTRENIEKNLRTYASYGVTTVLSLGTDQDLIFKIRDEQRAGRPTYTRVYTAGHGFTLKGGVGGMPSGTYNLEDAAEIPKDVDALAAKKVDIVKVWVDDSLGHRQKIPFEMTQGHHRQRPSPQAARGRPYLLLGRRQATGERGPGRTGPQRSRPARGSGTDRQHEEARDLAIRRHAHARGVDVRLREAARISDRSVFHAIRLAGRDRYA